MSNYQKVISLDFDGVIHRYSRGYVDGSIYDDPMPGALEATLRLIRRGYTIVVLTARTNHDDVTAWLIKNKFPSEHMLVTNVKPKAIAYIDDRAIRFTNWADVLNYF